MVLRPSPADILINGEFKIKTGAFLNSALISDLLPKEYELLIEKEGYHSWKKNVKVEEGQMTKILNVLLFKKNPSFEIFEENVEYFSFSPTGRKIIFQKSNKEIEVLAEEERKKFSIPEKINKIKWGDTENYFLIESETRYLIVETEKEKITFLKENIEQVSLNEEKVFYLKNNDLYSQNFTTEEELVLLSENVLTYTIKENNIFFMNESGFLKKTNLEGEIIKILNKRPFLTEENDLKIEVISEILFLRKNDKLFFINNNLESFKEIHHSVKELSYKNQIVFHNNHEVWLLNPNHLRDIKEREEIEKTFISRFSEKIKDCYWLNPHYLIFTVGDRIKISETDTKDIVNMKKIAEFKNPKIHWDNDKLYILENGTVFVSEEIIP